MSLQSSVHLFVSFPLSLQPQCIFLLSGYYGEELGDSVNQYYSQFPFTTFSLCQNSLRASQLSSFNHIFFFKSENSGQSPSRIHRTVATKLLQCRCLSLRYMLLEDQCGAVGESECVGLVREEQKEAAMYSVHLRSQLKTLTASIPRWLHNTVAVIVL